MAEVAKTPREMAIQAAEELLGTCDDLAKNYEDWQDNEEFCLELDDRVWLCELCSWWCEAGEQNEQGFCANCQDNGDDE